jgi:hypothetical protein
LEFDECILDKSKWEWMPCTFYIKQNIEDRTIVWSLKPSVGFGSPRTEVNYLRNIQMDGEEGDVIFID